METINARHQAVYDARQSGLTLQATGLQFGICQERVRQIVYGVTRIKDRASKPYLHDLPGFTRHDLPFISRLARKILKDFGIVDKAALLAVSDATILAWPNCGKKTGAEIIGFRNNLAGG